MKKHRIPTIAALCVGLLTAFAPAGNTVLRTERSPMGSPVLAADPQGAWHAAVSVRSGERYRVLYARAASLPELAGAGWTALVEGRADALQPRLVFWGKRVGMLWITPSNSGSELRVGLLTEEGTARLESDTLLSVDGEAVLDPSAAVSGTSLVVTWTGRSPAGARVRAAVFRLETGRVDRYEITPPGQVPVQSSVALGAEGRGAVVWTVSSPEGQALLCRTLLLGTGELDLGEAFPLALPVREIHNPVLLADAAGRLTCFLLGRSEKWQPAMVTVEPGEPPTAGPFTPLADEGQGSYLSAAVEGDGFFVQWQQTLDGRPPELVRRRIGQGRKPGSAPASGAKVPGDTVGSSTLASAAAASPGLVVCHDDGGYRLVLITEGRE